MNVESCGERMECNSISIGGEFSRYARLFKGRLGQIKRDRRVAQRVGGDERRLCRQR